LKNILKELREKRKLTQEMLATKLNVSRQTINSIETNKYVASLDLAIKIAKFFDLTVEDIFKI
jgi:putative transcriptional regulator